MRTTLVIPVLLGATLAGCLGSTTEAIDETIRETPRGLPDDFFDPLIMEPGHDHRDPTQHEFAWKMEQLDHHAMGGDALTASGAHALDIKNGFLFVAAYGGTVDIDGGVYIYDLTDPEHPTLRAQYRFPGNLGGDRTMEATEDADWIVLGTGANDCGGTTNPFGPGLYLLDFRDKENAPIPVDYLPITPEVHSVTVHRIDGVDYVFALGSFRGDNIYRIDTTGAKPALVGIGSVQIGHDSAVYDDPILGIPVLYVANDRDLAIYDVSAPATPKELGRWALSEAEHDFNYVHYLAMEMIQGRRILVVESENWLENASPLWIFDATDFASLELLANWTNPGGKPSNAHLGDPPVRFGFEGGQLVFSLHNPRLEDGIVYVAHYHGGVWALNISTDAKLLEPEIMGYFLPHEDNGGYRPQSAEGAYPKPNPVCGFSFDQMPNVFDVEVLNGIVYVADLHTGLYTVKLDPGAMADHGQ